jgi:hypothetical protein
MCASSKTIMSARSLADVAAALCCTSSIRAWPATPLAGYALPIRRSSTSCLWSTHVPACHELVGHMSAASLATVQLPTVCTHATLRQQHTAANKPPQEAPVRC